MVGLNHFSFVLDLWDHDTGEDFYSLLKGAVGAGHCASQHISAQILQETGYFPTAGDDRIRDFLDPTAYPAASRRPAPASPTDKERERRSKLLRAIADGKAPWDELLHGRSWEKPIDLIAAMAFDRPAVAFPSLNLLNTRQLPQLSRDIYVETAATVDRHGVRPAAEFTLPESILPLLSRVAELNDTIVRAARWSSQDLLEDAVELDSTILDKEAGRRALNECLKAHADILPAYS
jgi:alpha-galactosidase/6-phospho-beta-glucosidase family protein